MVMISASTQSMDFTKLGDEIKKLETSGVDMIHVDVMDGHFVPNFTFGPFVVKQIRPLTKLVFDTHLMVSNPDDMIPWFVEAGSDVITIHFEAGRDLVKSLKTIKASNRKAGLSINPATRADVLKPYLPYLDQILIMTVEPGYGGQVFMENQLEKISEIKELITGYNIKLEVDGGINPQTAKKCIAAGADILVAGTAVFKTPDYAANIAALKNGEKNGS